MKKLIQAGGVSAILLTAGTMAPAQEVRLFSTDGLVDFTGTLEDFDGDMYALRTSMGLINVPAGEVTCVGDACPSVNEVTSTFTITGAPSIQRFVMPELLDGYSLEVDTDISRGNAASGALLFELLSFEGDLVADVELTESSAADAFADLASGAASLGITTRRITDREAAALTGRDRAALDNLDLEHLIGLDGLVAVIGSGVEIESLTMDQMTEILVGSVTNWNEVGGPDLPISAFTRELGSDVRSMVDLMLMEPRNAVVGANVIGVDSNEGLLSAVDTFPNSIGIASISALGDVSGVAVPDACGVPISPSDFSVRTGAYPLSAPVFMYEAPGQLSVHGRGLVEFARSAQGQQVISRTGYIDLSTKPAPDAPAPVAGSVPATAERLTTAFTLDTGGRLDKRDEIEVQNLAQYIRSGRANGAQVTLVGLAETSSEAVQAARLVLNQLFARNPDVEQQLSVGFGLEGVTLAQSNVCLEQVGATPARVQVWVHPFES
ncbi:MAG: substrate-binding domain-containing protein [Pseudomonadota bacterium]